MRSFAPKQNQPQTPGSFSLERSDTAAPGQHPRADAILHLQRTIGNQAVQRLLQQAKPDDLEARPRTQDVTRSAHDFGQIPAHPQSPANVQVKLAVSSPGDIYEQEAERISERVMRMPEPQLQRACACGGGCPKCQTERPGQDHKRLQTKRAGTGELGQATAPPIVHEVLRSPGQPLDAATRGFMEPRFGHDFAQVRVHADAKAAESAGAVNALAYTVGRDVVFGAGQYQPNTGTGRQLLAHELSHTIQQGAAVRRLAQPGQINVVTTAMHSMRPTIQRALAFEFQIRDNTITTNKGRKFPRKFPNKQKGLDEYFHKGKTGVELQTDTGSVIEFETNWFRTWSQLEGQIQEAYDIVQEINAKTFAFSEEKQFQNKKLLATGEQLEVNIKDASFRADIQSTEGLVLSQYESLLKEHELTKYIDPVIKSAQKILDNAKKANKKIKPTAKLDNLLGFLQVIVNYIERAQHELWDATSVGPVKATFRLMHRTDFSSMYSSLLNADEKTLFKQIVLSEAIPQELGIAAKDQLFKTGYWGHYVGIMALFQGGKIVALATQDQQTIHDCSNTGVTPPAGIDKKWCGTSVPDAAITVDAWLKSIGSGKKDKLSPPHRGSESMGKGVVRTKGEEKGLAVFETRGYTPPRNRTQPASKWVDFADDVFKQAAACRWRPGTGTELIYDGNHPFDPAKCP